MITVGLVKELLFISKALKTQVNSSLETERMKHILHININGDVMGLIYYGFNIWREDVGSDLSMFGVESCDNISKIINLIDAGDTQKWRGFAYYEEQDLTKSEK